MPKGGEVLEFAQMVGAKEPEIEQPDVWKFGTPLISHPLLSK